jgi:hypothetical protein
MPPQKCSGDTLHDERELRLCGFPETPPETRAVRRQCSVRLNGPTYPKRYKRPVQRRKIGIGNYTGCSAAWQRACFGSLHLMYFDTLKWPRNPIRFIPSTGTSLELRRHGRSGLMDLEKPENRQMLGKYVGFLGAPAFRPTDSRRTILVPLVGLARFELATPTSQTWCANQTALQPVKGAV